MSLEKCLQKTLAKSLQKTLATDDSPPIPVFIVDSVRPCLVKQGWTIVAVIPQKQFTVQDTGDIITQERLAASDLSGLIRPLANDLRQCTQERGNV